MAAPACAAAIASCAISSGVMGRWGDMDGVCIDPVTAQVIMTLLDVLKLVSCSGQQACCTPIKANSERSGWQASISRRHTGVKNVIFIDGSLRWDLQWNTESRRAENGRTAWRARVG